MAYLQKRETYYRYSKFELTEEQKQLYLTDETDFNEQVEVFWEFTGDELSTEQIEIIE